MSYITSPVSIIYDNNGNPIGSYQDGYDYRLKVESKIDSNIINFNRLKSSNFVNIFDSKQIYDDEPLKFNNYILNSGATAYNNQISATTLSVTTAANDLALRQTNRYFNYQPGRNLNIFISFNLKTQNENTIKSIGYFDDNNGIFLKQTSDNIYLTKRSNTSGVPIDEDISQSGWNIDSLDGYGVSGQQIDFSKVQLMIIELEWFGAIGAKIGFVINNNIYYVHKFDYSNELDNVYIRTPNLPIRGEIRKIGASASSSDFDFISCSASQEGASDLNGIIRTSDRGVSSISTTTTLVPLISIRLKSNYNRAAIIPMFASIITSSTGNYHYKILVNPIITGGPEASWISVSNSAIEYDITQAGTVSSGIQLYSGYSSSQQSNTVINFKNIYYLTSNYLGVSDILVLAVQSVSNPAETYYGSLTWLEI